MTSLIVTLAVPLILTILIEYGVLHLLKENRPKILAASAVVNILTNVPLNYFISGYNYSALLWAEAAIVAIEALWYWFFLKDIKTAIVYSALCNTISFLSGLLIFLVISICG